MADDYSRRSYGRRDQPYRGGGATQVSQDQISRERASNHKPASDPLAELARLVGQNDPFGEYGHAMEDFRRASSQRESEPSYRASVHRASAPENQFSRPSSQWAPSRERPSGASTSGRIPERQVVNAGRVDFGDRDTHSGDEREHAPEYSVRAHGYGARPGLVPYEDGSDDSDIGPYITGEEGGYEGDEPRRPIGRWVLMGILALAVLGTAGAFAYHSFVGFSHTTRQPPIIKANSSPTKIVPTSVAQPKSGVRLDELADGKKGPEKIVSREEQPVVVNNESIAVVDQSSSRPVSPPRIEASQPKKIRTIAIRPDGTVLASAAPDESISPAAGNEPANTVRAPTPALEPPSGEAPEQKGDQIPSRKNSPGRVASNVAQRTNAPLSLSPTTGARPVVAPVRVASAEQPSSIPPSANIAEYGVQVSSQRSEDEARTALRNLQAKYPTQLGAKKFVIRKVDLGSKGIYYRALIGPFDNANAANELCGSLKAVGGQCIVQKN